MDRSPLIELRDVSFTYAENGRVALKNLNLSVESGEWVWIVGPGGSGKTTLCGLLSGTLLASTEGSLEGEFLLRNAHATQFMTEYAGTVGAVFQNPETGLVMDYVDDELAFGPENLCVEPEEIERRIDQALLHVGMPEARERRTSELSGGQQQRIAIGSVLTLQPEILVLDHAMANLDEPGIKQVMATLADLHQQGHTIIAASSRIDEAAVSSGDRLVIIENGSILADGKLQETMEAYQDTLIRMGCSPSRQDRSEASASQLNTKQKLKQHSAGQQAMQAAVPMAEQRAGQQAWQRYNTDVKATKPLLQITDLTFQYAKQSGKLGEPILDGIQLELFPEDFLALLGPNGSGKTTLGKLIAGLLPSPAHSIFIHGQDAVQCTSKQLAESIGYVFQNSEHQFVADTVLEECIFSLRMKEGLPPWGALEESHQAERIVQEGLSLLQQFGLEQYRQLHPLKLNIVEKRLLNLASAMILKPSIIILDEPTAGLDYASADRLMQLCATYANRGNAIILITHDMHTVHKWTNRKLVLG